MTYIEQPTVCTACGIKTDMLVAAEAASRDIIETLDMPCMVALYYLHQREDISWCKVITFDFQNGERQYLPITDQDAELIEQIQKSGRTLNHGDIYAADETGLVLDEADTEHVWVKGCMNQLKRAGTPDFVLTREHLTDPRLTSYLDKLLDPSDQSHASQS